VSTFPLQLRTASGPVRWFIGGFLVAMTFGYATGLYFVRDTTKLTAQGTAEQFRGNDTGGADGADPAEGAEIKFAKSTPELLTIVHTHVTSYALIFLGVGAVFLGSSAPRRLKAFLAAEPFVGTVVLFGAMMALPFASPGWAAALAWAMMLAGLLTTASFFVMAGWSFWDLLRARPGGVDR
jgi:hypothetical protein